MTSIEPLDPKKIADEVYSLAESADPLAPLVKEALDVIDGTLDKHGLEHVSISFNGGKDCTVLLHLFAASLSRRGIPSTQPIPSIYIPLPSPFGSMESFIADSVQRYNLSLFACPPPTPGPVESVSTPGLTPAGSRVSTPGLTPVGSGLDLAGLVRHPRPRPVGQAKGGEGMRAALELYKEEFPEIEAILVGTRRGDPHGAKLSHSNPCDPGWPAFERVHPVINWSYTDVWDFLLKLNVPYCQLYDLGYTSLGSTYNTFPNPALLVPDTPEGSEPKFRPAYELRDGNLERDGRAK